MTEQEPLLEALKNVNTDYIELIIKNIYFKEVNEKLKEENYVPKNEDIFKAFTYFNIEETKLVIIGMDPYPEPDNVTGLAFSVRENSKIPSSLRNIYKELMKERLIERLPKTGDLTLIARQGVLLLNMALTIVPNKTGSHSKIWYKFTTELITQLSELNKKCIFILMGNEAKKLKKNINNEERVITSAHPSPLSIKLFIGCNIFLDANVALIKMNLNPIDYSILNA